MNDVVIELREQAVRLRRIAGSLFGNGHRDLGVMACGVESAAQLLEWRADKLET